jgi:hypothetical protein
MFLKKMQNLLKENSSKVNYRLNTTSNMNPRSASTSECHTNRTVSNEVFSKSRTQTIDAASDYNKIPSSPVWKPRIMSQYSTDGDTDEQRNGALKEKSKKRIKFNFADLTTSKSHPQNRAQKCQVLQTSNRLTSNF